MSAVLDAMYSHAHKASASRQPAIVNIAAEVVTTGPALSPAVS
jgi:hypothetical protein